MSSAINLTPEQTAAFRREVFEAQANLNFKLRTGRYSFGFLMEIVQHAINRTYNVHSIYDEIGCLEDPRQMRSITKKAKSFRRSVLKGYWHKHHYQAEFLRINVLDELDRADRMEEICKPHFGQPLDEVVDKISFEMVVGSYKQRADRRALAGEWIVFEKINGANYYLTLASHPRPPDKEKKQTKILSRILAYKDIDTKNDFPRKLKEEEMVWRL